jgi:hypothetical protein
MVSSSSDVLLKHYLENLAPGSPELSLLMPIDSKILGKRYCQLVYLLSV